MSTTILDNLSLSNLTPGRFPATDGDQVLVDSPLSRIHRQVPVVQGDNGGAVQSALISGDLGDTVQGSLFTGGAVDPYGIRSPLSSIVLRGVNGSNSDAGILSWSFTEDGGGYLFEVFNGVTLVASAVVDDPYPPFEVEVVEEGASGISGSIIVVELEEAVDIGNQKIIVPFSRTQAVFTGDEGNIASIALAGVTNENSNSGVLYWKYRTLNENDEGLVFTLGNGERDFAQAVYDSSESPDFPIELEISELNYSGLSGILVLSGAYGISFADPLEGMAAVKAYSSPQIESLELSGVSAGNSANGVLSWKILNDGPDAVFEVYNGVTLVASGAAEEDETSGFVTIALEQEAASGISGAVVLRSHSDATDTASQKALIPLSRTEAILAGDIQSGNISAVTLEGVTLRNSNAGRLKWTYSYSDSDSGILTFTLKRHTVPVAEAVLSLGGYPAFPIQVDISEIDYSGITGSVTLEDFVGLEVGVSENGTSIVQAARSQAQINSLALLGVTDANSEGGRLSWEIFRDGDLKVALYNGATEVALASGDPESFPATLEFSQSNASGISGSIVLASGHEVRDLEAQFVMVPLSATQATLSGDETLGNIGSVTLHGVTAKNSTNGRLSWSYAFLDEGYGVVSFQINGPVEQVALAEYIATEETVFPLELPIEALNESGISGTLVLAGNDGLTEDSQTGWMTLMIPGGVRAEGSLEVEGRAAVSGSLHGDQDLAASEVEVAWGLSLPPLATDIPQSLVVNDEGILTAVPSPIQTIFTQYDVADVALFYSYEEPTEEVPLFLPDGDLASVGSRIIPEAWWASGKKIMINVSFAWSVAQSSGLTLRFFLDGTYGYESYELIALELPEYGNPAESGEEVAELELMVAEDGETFDLRGHIRLNDSVLPVDVTGVPRGDYEITGAVAFQMSDPEDNFVQVRSASITAYEAPAGGLAS